MTTANIYLGAQFLTIVYDAQGRRQSTMRGASQTSYTYDPVSRLASDAQTFASGTLNTTTTFGYNPASQITSQLRTNDAYAFAGYSTASNSYAVNGLNQYTAVGAGSLGYDSNGNLAATSGTSFTYDVENRLVNAVGTLNASLAYDPMGRLWQTSGGSFGTTQFLYDGDALIGEYDGLGNLLRRYVHGPSVDEPVMWVEGSDLSILRFYHPDHQGSIIATADASGAPFETYSYDEYGVPSTGNYTSNGRFQYTGQTWLPELGMYYYKARIYSAKLGRFLQIDPIGYADQMDLYAYVGNDPVDRRDSSGEDGWSVVHGVLAVASFCPSICGSLASGIDAGVYAAQGDRLNAVLAGGAALVGGEGNVG
jgi:RHS repeat-associated protein